MLLSWHDGRLTFTGLSSGCEMAVSDTGVSVQVLPVGLPLRVDQLCQSRSPRLDSSSGSLRTASTIVPIRSDGGGLAAVTCSAPPPVIGGRVPPQIRKFQWSVQKSV